MRVVVGHDLEPAMTIFDKDRHRQIARSEGASGSRVGSSISIDDTLICRDASVPLSRSPAGRGE